ncbi:MAG: ATP-binding domain-containing protein [Polyangiaceae bacterium]|nr:ATP-binding domain-containing protein [Polyangiaceae bacterium]
MGDASENVKGNTTNECCVVGLESDEQARRIVGEELRLLEIVLGAIGPATGPDSQAGSEGTNGPSSRSSQLAFGSGLAQALADDDRRLLELRDAAAVAKPEDLPALLEQMHHLGALRAHRGKGMVGSVDRKAPYFAHLRLQETVIERCRAGSKERRRDILVGSRQYVDPACGVRIVDWRNAPVSRIFYRYREDDSYEETLGDHLVEGTVVARRTVAIVNGELRKVTSPQGIFVRDPNGRWRRAETHVARLRLPGSRHAPEHETGHENAASAASQGTLNARSSSGTSTSADRLLPAIAAMLDKEQYDLITRPGAGLVAIQGSAGSGKTTVGLHRVAFLHATSPNTFRPHKMLVIVPNEALVHYTSRVLPELGVDGVPVMTFSRWSLRVLADIFPKLPSAVSEETPPLVSRVKNHPAMLLAMGEVASEIMARLHTMVERAMARWPFGNKVVLAWRAARGAPDRRVTHLLQWVTGKKELSGIAAGSLPEVTRSAALALCQQMRSESRAVLAAWDDVTTNRLRLNKHFRNDFGKGQLDQVHEWCVRQARIRAEGERDGATPTIDFEDRALILRLFQLLRGPIVDADGVALSVPHLFVDEVQDTSPIELKVLLDVASGMKDDAVDPSQLSITLAGDVAQRMREEDDEHAAFDWDATLKELGVPGGAGVIEPLKVSYRSTAEITSFAQAVLGPLAHDAEPIANRQGPPVELFSFSSAGECVAFLADALRELAADEPEANVALLARFAQQADVYYEGLVRAEVPNVRRVRHQDFTWERGFDITDIRQTKGLEFDEVILLETTRSSYPETPQARQALYVGATRAAYQLWCTTSDTPSTLVTGALPTPAS